MLKYKNTTTIIRSAGERTINACYSLLSDYFSEHQIHLIKEVPFSKAVRRSLEIGLEKKSPWILCIDADVLIDKNGIKKLLDKTADMPPEVFETQGLVLDKFFPILRPAGNHLYRTSYAEKALKFISKDNTLLRPEASMISKMSQNGNPWFQSDIIVGIHDFEQSYFDIFRKCYLHGKKHQSWLPFVYKNWFAQSFNDADFQIAIAGALFGLTCQEKGTLSFDSLAEEFSEILTKTDLNEKDRLNLSNAGTLLKNALACYTQNRFQELQDFTYPKSDLNKINYLKKGKPEFIRNILKSTGWFFQKTGQKLDFWANK